jgi:hypothetical protein
MTYCEGCGRLFVAELGRAACCLYCAKRLEAGESLAGDVARARRHALELAAELSPLERRRGGRRS